jgi:TonB-linked SusC/RagA family outer membrane protein
MRKLLLLMTVVLLSSQLWAQKTVTGKVTDDKGNPVANASVLVKGTKTGTTTNSFGIYKITVPSNSSVLVISSVDMEPQEVNIAGKSVVNITLKSAEKVLQEVVITGIGRQKRSQFAGAANKIETKDLVNKPVGSLDQLLQGRAPGVLALTGSGQPGNSASIIIRGTNSIVGGSTPLYVIDGIPVEASVFQGLNPNDFASIDVLRDAASLALYGSRGSAGVIVITTKRGSGGKMKLSYSGQFGIKSRPEFAFRPMNTAELLQAQKDYGTVLNNNSTYLGSTNIPGWYYSKDNPRYATLGTTGQAQADHLLDSISQINTNWADYFFRQGSFSNHQITLSGGTGKTRVYSSVALYNEQGTTTRTDMTRATLRNNIDYADEKLTFSASSTLGYTKRNFQQSTTTNSTANPFLDVNIAEPYALVYKPDGSYSTGNGSKYVGANQLDLTKYDQNYNDQIKGTIGFNIAYRITKDITLSLVTGADFRETQNTVYASKLAYLRTAPASPSITAAAGGQTESLERFLTSNVRPSVTYRKTFADKHEVEVTALGEYVQENYKFFTLTGYGIDPRTPNTPGAITPGNSGNQLYIAAGGNKDRTGLASGLIMGRYTFDGKYTLTGSFRDDGSSKLPPATRWQNFFSVGGIWDATKESFLEGKPNINTLRLRASYGSSGNANNFPSSYLYQATYGTGTYSGLTTQVATYPGNPQARWEKTFVTNIGVDFEFLKRRLYGDINVYDKRTKDLFVAKQLSAEGGGFSINVNAGELQNKGIEWNINYDVIRKNGLVWTLTTTGSYNKNKLLSLGGEQPYLSGTSYLKIGLPLGTQYTVKWGGVDAATGAPLYYDLNGNLTTTYSADNSVAEFGTWEAPWKGGFGTNIRYNNFEFSTLFSWQKGAYKMDNLEYFVENPVGFLAGGYNQSSSMNFWKKPGDIASTPSPLYGTNFSSKLIHDASFLRLRDVTISYSLPVSVIEKIKFISNFKLYVQGTNLFIWTKWRGMDPEAGPVNINLSEYPNPRAFTGGIDITF